MTLPEVLLWQALRLRPGGFKFRLQRAVGRYVLDFCYALRAAPPPASPVPLPCKGRVGFSGSAAHLALDGVTLTVGYS